MTTAAIPAPEGAPAMPSGRRLWLSQALTVAAQELRRGVLGLRGLGLAFLCGFPILIVSILTAVRLSGAMGRGWTPTVGGLASEYAVFYQTLLLRLVVFFVCALVFSRLFRVEIQQRSLHYYFLAPLRREVFAVGKFLAGLVLTAVTLSVATAATFLVFFYPLSMNAGSGGFGAFLTSGGGFGQMLLYIAISCLGALGYGAAFFALGLYFKNPILPIIALYGLEWINFLLPPLLKKLSIIHYLQSLQPVPVSQGALAILGEPSSPLVAIPGLILVSMALLWLSVRKARTMEIEYGDE